MAAPDPERFAIHRAEVRPGVELAYLRENAGGRPLLLIHGWPETMRIWWRCVEPLAAAGFEVIVPDLRGFGSSSLAPDGCYDLAAHADDLHALVAGVLGHERCAAAGGDLGGAVLCDLALRRPGFVARACAFNCPLPLLGERYEQAGLPAALPPAVRMAADYFLRQGRDADGLAAELDTPERRRRYIAEFYGHRFWAAPGTFTPEEVAFMTEPFADPDRLRASFANYESALGTIALSGPPRFFEPVPVPTLLLYGPEDHVIFRDWPARAAIAFPDHAGPQVIAGAGHFLQWEQADAFCGLAAPFLAADPA